MLIIINLNFTRNEGTDSTVYMSHSGSKCQLFLLSLVITKEYHCTFQTKICIYFISLFLLHYCQQVCCVCKSYVVSALLPVQCAVSCVCTTASTVCCVLCLHYCQHSVLCV